MMSEFPAPIRLLIADDHPMVIAGIKTFLADEKHIEIVGEANHGHEVIEKAKELQPDIILMDISMPGINGLEATRILRKELPMTEIIVLTMHGEKEYVLRFVKLGVNGYVLKNAPQSDILKAIEDVSRGKAHFSPEIQKIIKEGFSGEDGNLDVLLPDLTFMERRVFLHIAQGNSNKELADKFLISVRTVEKHRERIAQKMELRTQKEYYVFAVKHGLLKE
ncbi:MAG: response regulator transcription factor [Bacteroidetes bacterium]|nr:MAG: response regulator transcription factor [Bacteroidota bacterium]